MNTCHAVKMTGKERERKKFRMDFVLEKAERIPTSRNKFRFVMKPDPRVWEVVKEHGKEAWYNKIDRVLIPMEEFKKAVETARGIPIAVSSITVEGIGDYILKSKERIEEETEEETTD